MNNIKNGIIYFGFNNPLKHKRGVENVILFQSDSLEDNFDKYYIFFDNEDNEFIWENINCISIKHNFLRFYKLNRIVKKLSKKKIFLIHSHNYLMSFFLLRKTDIFTVHDGLYYMSSQSNHKLKNVFKLIEKVVYKKVVLTHFISRFSKNTSLYKKNKFIIIYNTTPLEKIYFMPKYKNINDSKLRLFTVRSIEERANIDLLVKLAEENKNYDITIAGKGPLLSHYRNLIEEKKILNIRLLGYIEDEKVRENYSLCDLVIVLSKYGEGFGLPIIEGYLHNKPVFASNVCAIPEVIIDKKFLIADDTLDISTKINEYFKKKNSYDFIKYYNENFLYDKILKEYNVMYTSYMMNKMEKVDS